MTVSGCRIEETDTGGDSEIPEFRLFRCEVPVRGKTVVKRVNTRGTTSDLMGV